MKEKRIKFERHGSEYFLCKSKKYGNALCGRALLQNGSVDKEEWQVEESPKSFKSGHIETIKKLGIKSQTDINKIIKKIDYY